MDHPGYIKIEGDEQLVATYFLLEGVPIEDIANTVDEGPKGEILLSYDDVISYFGLSMDVYTPMHHDRLLEEMESGGHSEFLLRDGLPKNVLGRTLLEASDISLQTKCELESNDFSVVSPSFELALGNLAVDNAYQAMVSGYNMITEYLWIGLDIEARGFQITDPWAAAFLMYGLNHDVDPSRVDPIKKYLKDQGCADIARDKICIDQSHAVPPEKGNEYIKTPPCRYFKEDLQCVFNVIQGGLLAMGRKIDSAGGLETYRQQNKANVYTNFVRALNLKSIFTFLSAAPAILPKQIQKILIVGPGLETINPTFSITASQQTFEPFAVMDIALEKLGARFDPLYIDVIDINPRVVSHLSAAKNAAKKGKSYKLYVSLPYEKERDENKKQKIPFALHLPGTIRTEEIVKDRIQSIISIPPAVLGHLHPFRGDIITDYVNPAESYDMVFILNVLIYFDDSEKRLAMDNIGRLLKKGGILITDVIAKRTEREEHCKQLPGHGLENVFSLPFPMSMESASGMIMSAASGGIAVWQKQ